MKLIHLSDLHLGKRINEISLIDDQAHILGQIIRIAEDEKAEAVLIAGDVYDKSVPSAEAVMLFDKFICAFSDRRIPVLIISGNHDSAERLSFGNRLLAECGIHICSAYDGEVEHVSFTDHHGKVVFWLLPFIKPAHVRRFYPDSQIESYTDAVRVALGSMEIDPDLRNVLLTHQFVTGATTCESEELSVGGSENVDASVFDCFDYVALGHIHGPQNIGSNRIRYCGTPLKYSFSEAKHYKSVTVVELGEKGTLHLHTVPLQPLRDLREIRGSFAEITAHGDACSEDYVHIILTDEEDVPEAIGKLRMFYPNLMKLTYDNQRTRLNQVIDCAQDVQRKSPLELFEELYELQNNQPMSEEQRCYANDLIEVIWEESL